MASTALALTHSSPISVLLRMGYLQLRLGLKPGGRFLFVAPLQHFVGPGGNVEHGAWTTTDDNDCQHLTELPAYQHLLR
jgi:hypothetical protein